MDVAEIVKDHRREEVRKFFKKLKESSELDAGALLPRHLYPEVVRGPNESSRLEDAQAYDRKLASELLENLKNQRAEFPELAAEYVSVLKEAEKVWKDCIAR